MASGSYCVPLSKVRAWRWETYWLSMAVVAWLIMPLAAAWVMVPRLTAILLQSPPQSVAVTLLLGMVWGIGAVTSGLAFRYLGVSLAMAIVMGVCAAFGTLMPPVTEGQFGQLLTTFSGMTLLAGVLLCLLGVALCSWAGSGKEAELTSQEKRASIREFALVKGFVVAVISGVMSAGLPYALYAGKPLAQVAVDMGTLPAYRNHVVFLVAVVGGFVVNALFCLALNVRNRSLGQYVAGPVSVLLRNYVLVVMSGVFWYTGILLYGMATTMLGQYAFTAWSTITALVIVVSTLWGLALKEWKGVSSRTLRLLGSGIAVLILSVVVIGVGNHLATGL
jgi:L-rhamnose-H+ transport protein